MRPTPARFLVVAAALFGGSPALAADGAVAHEILGPPPWLGVSMDKGSDIGVPVQHVVRGSPAHRGGLRSGDRIVSLDGVSVSSPVEVTRAVQARRVGATLNVAYERAGAASTVAVTLSGRPSGDEILRMDLVGAPAPAWANVGAVGAAPAAIEQLRGRVVVVDFWATWCGPCRLLAPKLSALKERFAAQGLQVVGITTDAAEKAAVFAERHAMRYGVVVDRDGETSRAYGVTSLPTMVVVDKRGVVREVLVGYDPTGDARLETLVKGLLAEQAPPPVHAPPPGAAEAPRPR